MIAILHRENKDIDNYFLLLNTLRFMEYEWLLLSEKCCKAGLVAYCVNIVSYQPIDLSMNHSLKFIGHFGGWIEAVIPLKISYCKAHWSPSSVLTFFSIKTKHNSLLYPIFLVYLWKFMMGMYSLLTQLVHSWYLRYYSLF